VTEATFHELPRKTATPPGSDFARSGFLPIPSGFPDGTNKEERFSVKSLGLDQANVDAPVDQGLPVHLHSDPVDPYRRGVGSLTGRSHRHPGQHKTLAETGLQMIDVRDEAQVRFQPGQDLLPDVRFGKEILKQEERQSREQNQDRHQ
jgi:hypothetical protein